MARRAILDRDRGFAALAAELRDLARGYRLDVGVIDTTGSKRHPKADMTVTQLAAIHEFGTATIPARPFIRRTFDGGEAGYARMTRDAIRRVTAPRGTSASAELQIIGARIAADMRATLDRGVPPPLAPSTVARKGHALALVDTGTLRRSIGYLVTATSPTTAAPSAARGLLSRAAGAAGRALDRATGRGRS